MDPNPYLSPQGIRRDGRAVPLPWAGLGSVAIALLASAVFVFALRHFQVDRTNRRPVITLVGPAANWVRQLLICGFALSVVGGVLGYKSCEKLSLRAVPGAIGFLIAFFSLVLAGGFLLSAYED
jgi:hypothetical protein